MSLLKDAFEDLYGKNSDYDLLIKYSAKFKPYRANIKLRNNTIQFNLSKKWKNISREIQIGLIQELLLKILKNKLKPLKTRTFSIELYNHFIKKLHIAAPKTKTDPILEKSFDRVNEKYFYGMLDKTNLIWGKKTLRKLGSYEYATDTITISSLFRDEDTKLLDYIMYHEMLHKKHKFYTKNGRSYHHTKEFRKKEREFENNSLMENKIKELIRKKKSFFNKFFFV